MVCNANLVGWVYSIRLGVTLDTLMIKKRILDLDLACDEGWSINDEADDGEAAFWDEFWFREEESEHEEEGVKMTWKDENGKEELLNGVVTKEERVVKGD